jgi:Nucleotidyltransferase of unknown function (DUF6036)
MPATRTISRALRDEALNLLDRRGSILELAREISQIMRRRKITGAVIGGVAVVLHGHTRSTTDVDVFVDQPLLPIVEHLISEGFTYDESSREFSRGGVPLHLVTREQITNPPRETVEIEGVTTVSLADLIEMKLASGTRNMLRAQDLADVIGLIRHNRLTGEFAKHLEKSLRPAFRKLVKAIEQEGRGRSAKPQES